MTTIEVSIVRWVDDQNPGWVECQLVDAFGKTWQFVDKLPIFSEDSSLDSTSHYPQSGMLACEVTEGKIDNMGRKLSLVDTAMPWGIESVDGANQFYVFLEQIKST